MRDYTITKIRPGTYELDLYVNGSWVDTKRGTKGEVEQFASKYINKRMPRPFRAIMSQTLSFSLGQRSTLEEIRGCFFSTIFVLWLDNCPVSRYNDYVVLMKRK